MFLFSDFLEAPARPSDRVHRDHPAEQPPGIRGRKFQGALREHRDRAEPEGEPLMGALHRLEFFATSVHVMLVLTQAAATFFVKENQ